jgi:hypothetical protein
MNAPLPDLGGPGDGLLLLLLLLLVPLLLSPVLLPL